MTTTPPKIASAISVRQPAATLAKEPDSSIIVIMAGKPRYATEEARRDARKANIARYNASPKRKAAMKRYQNSGRAAEATRRYRQGPKYASKRAMLTPDQFSAWTAIRYATQSGKVARPTNCQQCGADKRIEGHHHRGYAPDHRLDVQWLCGECHIAAHPKKSRH